MTSSLPFLVSVTSHYIAFFYCASFDVQIWNHNNGKRTLDNDLCNYDMHTDIHDPIACCVLNLISV